MQYGVFNPQTNQAAAMDRQRREAQLRQMQQQQQQQNSQSSNMLSTGMQMFGRNGGITAAPGAQVGGQMTGNTSGMMGSWMGQNGAMGVSNTAPIGGQAVGSFGGLGGLGGGAISGSAGLMGGGAATSGIGAGGTLGSFAGGAGGLGGLGGASAGGGGSAMGGLAAAGPWAALAAAVIGNENYARNRGDRRDGTDYYKDLATGRVLSQDVDNRWAPMFFGKSDNQGLGKDMSMAASLGSFQPGKAWGEFKDSSLMTGFGLFK